MKKKLTFYFPATIKTYAALCIASVLTFFAIILLEEATTLSQEFFKENIVNYPWYGIFTPFVFAAIIYIVKYKCFFIASSGIPQVLAALKSSNKPIRNRLLSFRIAFFKIVFIFVATLFGAPIGIEGPSVHIGASIFYNISQIITLKRKIIIHSFMVIGGSVGLLVAFNAPLAAMSFAFEELGKGAKKHMRMMVVLASVFISLSLYIAFDRAPYLANLILDFDYMLIWQLLPIAFICGILGGIFAKLTLNILSILTTTTVQKTLSIAFILGAIVAAFNYVSAGVVAGSGKIETIQMLGGGNLGIEFVIMKFFSTLSSLVSTIPGGLFMPSISIGAGIGAEFSELFTNFLTLDTQSIVVFSMVAYLSGVIRAPITSALVILEMTTTLNLVIPALLIALLSSYISSKIQPVPLYLALSRKFK